MSPRRRNLKDGVKKDGVVILGGSRVARVSRVGKTWTLFALTVSKKVLGEDYRTRKSALEDLPRILKAEERRRKREWKKRQAERKAREEKAREEAKDPRCLARYVERIRAAAPEGWTVEVKENAHWFGRNDFSPARFKPEEQNEYRRNAELEGACTVILRSETEALVWRVSRPDPEKTWMLEDGACGVSGTTEFVGDQGSWRTFDRRGVEDSFYTGSLRDPAEVVKEQLERIEKSREVGKQMISVPNFGWRVHRDALPKIKEKLRNGGSHFFTPSGFGTGYRVSVRRPSHRYGVEKLSAETAAFFDVPVLWAESVDCD